MTDEEKFEKWFATEIEPTEFQAGLFALKMRCQQAWLEKGKRDREKVVGPINHVLSYNLPYLAEKRLRELLKEIG